MCMVAACVLLEWSAADWMIDEMVYGSIVVVVFFFQAEDGIRDLVRSRGLGDVYKRQRHRRAAVHRTLRGLSAQQVRVRRGLTQRR